MLGDDKYTYPGSGGVLRNSLDIEDSAELDRATDAFVSVEWADLLRAPCPAKFDFAYLQAVHHQLFHMVFSWAGQVRDVELLAAGTGRAYCRADQVRPRLDAAFARLAGAEYLCGLDSLEFAAALADTWTDLTYIHPFRDGNTRSQSFFVSRLAEAAGHPIAWERVDVDSLRRSRLAAVGGHREALVFFIENHLVNPPSLW